MSRSSSDRSSRRDIQPGCYTHRQTRQSTSFVWGEGTDLDAAPWGGPVAGALLALLEGARKEEWGNEPMVRKLNALQAKYDASDK